MHRITLSIELHEDDRVAADAEILTDELRNWADEWEREVFEFRRWEVRDSTLSYVGDSWLPRRSPNGIWWALKGHLRFTRDGRRIHVSMSRTLGSRGVFFAVPPRRRVK